MGGVVRGPYLGVKARDEWREVRMSDERASRGIEDAVAIS